MGNALARVGALLITTRLPLNKFRLNEEAARMVAVRVTRPILAALLAMGSLSSLFQIASAESPDEKGIHDVLEARLAAQLDSDFPRLVSLLNPSTQRLFRDQLSARFDELQRIYSFDQISAISGLPGHPKDLKLSDPEFFIFACEQARARHPDLDRKYLPFDIRESTFHGDSRVDVTLSYSEHVHTERTDYSSTFSFVIVLQREKSQWQVLSCPLAHVIAYNWSRDLACPAAPAR